MIGFKHSFLCLNPKNGGLGSKIVCLAIILTFWIQKFSLFIWYSNGRNWDQLLLFSVGFSYCSKDWWQFCNFFHKLTSGILVIKTHIFPSFSDIFNGHRNYSSSLKFLKLSLSSLLPLIPVCHRRLGHFSLLLLLPLRHRLTWSFLIITLNFLINPQLTLFLPSIKMASQPSGESRTQPNFPILQ